MRWSLFISFWVNAICWSLAPSAEAQILGQGLVNASGNYTYNVGTLGAMTNRQTANQLFQQSMQDNASGWSSFPPNFGQLAKALTEYNRGIKADNQAHSFAQSALGGVDTGTTSGQLDLTRFNSVGVSTLNDLVTTSSPYYATARTTAVSYGITTTEDGQYMKTPFGTFPTDITPDQAVKIMKGIADSLGVPVSTKELNDGVQAGLAAAQNFAAQNQAAIESSSHGGAGAPGGAFGTGAIAGDPKSANGQAGNGQGPRARALAGGPAGLTEVDKNGIDWSAREREIAAYRDKMLKDLHLEPIGAKDQDIFQMVHERYVSLDKEDHFVCEPTALKSKGSLAFSWPQSR